jgi:signal peptidase I
MAKKRSTAPKQSRASRPTATAEPPRWHAYFSAGTIRETVESIVVAFVLAFLFRTFEAEAFVIPTGSMAPTLMGAHKDVLCPTCDFRYEAGASSEAEDVAQQRGIRRPATPISFVTCPMCRTTTDVDPRSPQGQQYPTYGGDRILVSKFTFEFSEPRRWDVTVFKYPGGAETNYIKRLVGLPGETLRIWHGNLYAKPRGGDDFHFERRTPSKLRAMAQIVYNNDYVVEAMTAKGWPVRWQPWPASDSKEDGGWTTPDGSRSYAIDGSAEETRWLGYRHFTPSIDDWKLLDEGPLPEGHHPRPRLITDFYAYNTSVQRGAPLAQPQMLGLHWVGDLMLDCQLDVTDDDGKALFELIEGGAHFDCELDCKTGQARLSIDGLDDYGPKAQTDVRGVGSHSVTFANIDDQLLLWVDGSPVVFDGPTSYPPLGNDRPTSSSGEPGDLMPARIGSQGAGLRVSQLRLLRDIYYIAADGRGPVSDYHGGYALLTRMRYQDLLNFWSSPSLWAPDESPSPFDQRQEAIYPLDEDQFFVLGDNSPLSQDARLWPAERYVARHLLVGKAIYIFWPHSFDRVPGTRIPFPFFPNFARMGFIR